MNQKELSELRRRFRPERSAVSRVYGCYVNGSGEIISDLDESLGAMPQEEEEKYLGLLKKALSGTLGKNLIDIVFSTQQVMDSPEHRLLTGLRDSALKDGALRQDFYRKVIDALDMARTHGRVAEGALLHSDHGTQYTSQALTTYCTQAGITQSMGQTGVAWDNAVAETFFASLKNEMYHHQVFTTRARARMAVAEYIEVFYNRQRPHSSLDYRTPVQAWTDHETLTTTPSTQAA